MAVEAARAAALQPKLKPAPAPQPPRVDRAAAVQEREKTRDWILQYAQGQSDSEDEGDEVCRQALHASWPLCVAR
jgi:hypothetical protein